MILLVDGTFISLELRLIVIGGSGSRRRIHAGGELLLGHRGVAPRRYTQHVETGKYPLRRVNCNKKKKRFLINFY